MVLSNKVYFWLNYVTLSTSPTILKYGYINHSRPTQDVSPVLSPQRLECPPGYMHYRRPSDEAANILRNYSSGNRCTHTMMACTCIILRPIQIYILSGYMQEPMRDKDLKGRPTAVPCYRLLARNFQMWHTATIRDVALV